MTEFERGDVVELIEIDEIDEERGLALGDLGVIVHDTSIPFVTFIDNNRCPVTREQIKLVYRKPKE